MLSVPKAAARKRAFLLVFFGLGVSTTQCVSKYEVLGERGATSQPGAGAGADASGAAGESFDLGCVNDAECTPGDWCVEGECRPCAWDVPCLGSFASLERNGCPWCVPSWDCNSNWECAGDDLCYPGRVCESGCGANSTCCFGNVCSAPGCGSTEGLDCAVVGCPDGYFCNIVDPDRRCSCVAGSWECTPGLDNTCDPL